MYTIGIRPIHSGQLSLAIFCARHNKYQQWLGPLLEKKQLVLHKSMVVSLLACWTSRFKVLAANRAAGRFGLNASLTWFGPCHVSATGDELSHDRHRSVHISMFCWTGLFVLTGSFQWWKQWRCWWWWTTREKESASDS